MQCFLGMTLFDFSLNGKKNAPVAPKLYFFNFFRILGPLCNPKYRQWMCVYRTQSYCIESFFLRDFVMDPSFLWNALWFYAYRHFLAALKSFFTFRIEHHIFGFFWRTHTSFQTWRRLAGQMTGVLCHKIHKTHIAHGSAGSSSARRGLKI